MNEDPSHYPEPESSLRKLDHDLKAIQQAPTTSHWLQRAVTELWQRDVVDALNNLDVMRELLEEKHRIHTLLLKMMVTSHDGTRH